MMDVPGSPRDSRRLQMPSPSHRRPTVPLSDDRRELVRRGYDEMGAMYDAARPLNGQDAELLPELHRRIPSSARVLDLGCGAGVPIARRLPELGHEVVGVDISMVQLGLAKSHVPRLRPVVADMSALPVRSGAF